MFLSEIEALDYLQSFKALFKNYVMDESAYQMFVDRSDKVPKFLTLPNLIENGVLLVSSPTFLDFTKDPLGLSIKKTHEVRQYNLFEYSLKEFAFIYRTNEDYVYGLLKKDV